MVAVGAGEGAAAVAEQLAFEQVARDGGAVEGDERLLRRGRRSAWMARARISLPVPLSPVMRTLTLVEAMRRARAMSFRMCADGDGLAVVERQFVDGPEGGALLAFEPRAFEVMDGVDEEFDRVDCCNRTRYRFCNQYGLQPLLSIHQFSNYD